MEHYDTSSMNNYLVNNIDIDTNIDDSLNKIKRMTTTYSGFDMLCHFFQH